MLIDDRRPEPDERRALPMLDAGHVATVLLLAVVGIGTWMSFAHGGYHIDVWGPASLCVLGLCALLLAGTLPRCPAAGRWSTVALAAIWSYAAWSAASIGWASDASVAWESAGRSAMYAAIVSVVALLARTPGVSLRTVLACWVGATALVAATTLVLLHIDPAQLVHDGRLIGTVGYFNAQATMLLLPTSAGLWMATDTSFPRWLRAGAVGAMTLCASTALLAQSRGAVLALAAAAVLLLVLAPRRASIAGTLGLVAACAAGMIGPTNALHASFDPRTDTSSVELAAAAADRAWILAAIACLLGYGWLLLADHGHERARRRLASSSTGRPGPAFVAVGAAAATACAIGVIMLPQSQFVRGAAADLRTPTINAGDDSSRLTSMSSNGRFQLWQTSMEIARLQPLRGVGGGSWEPHYYQLRDHAGAYVRQPHNLTLEALTEHGAIGAGLLLTFVVAVYAHVVPRRGQPRSAASRALLAVAAATFTQWLLHAQLEWLWQLPAATWPAMFAAGLLLAGMRETERPLQTRPARRALQLALLPLVLLVAAATAAPWVADRFVQQAAGSIAGDPAAAARALTRAELLNPVSTDAARERLALARTQRDKAASTVAIRDYIRRAPDHWATYESIAMQLEASGDAGDARLARRMHEMARDRNPRGFEFIEPPARAGRSR